MGGRAVSTSAREGVSSPYLLKKSPAGFVVVDAKFFSSEFQTDLLPPPPFLPCTNPISSAPQIYCQEDSPYGM